MSSFTRDKFVLNLTVAPVGSLWFEIVDPIYPEQHVLGCAHTPWSQKSLSFVFNS